MTDIDKNHTPQEQLQPRIKTPTDNIDITDNTTTTIKCQDIEIIPVRTPTDLKSTIQLFKSYAISLNLDLSFQSFDQELAALPGRYHPSQRGELLLARLNLTHEGVGCIALRHLPPTQSNPSETNETKTGEIKRLYTIPSIRGLGIGHALARRIIQVAEELGYHEIKLDTLPDMLGAQKVYEKLGFVDVDEYCFNPVQGVRFMGLKLRE